MVWQQAHPVQHTVPVAAPAHVVYGLLADAPSWPLLLAGHLHVERMDLAPAPGDATHEHLRMWDLRDGHVRSTLARRLLRPAALSIDFEQHETLLPGAPLHGTWTVRPQGREQCLLTLQHRPPPAGTGTLPPDTRAETERVRAGAESWQQLDELLLSFEDSLHIRGPAEVVYDFLYRIEDWPRLLPHVERAEVREDQPGIQFAALDTCATETGRTLTTHLVRLCFPHAARIIHRHTTTPGAIAAHSGEWSLQPEDGGVRAVSAHRVLLHPQPATTTATAATTTPGAATGATAGASAVRLADTRRYVRAALGRASTETLTLARWHAESAVRRLR
ncbi:SRPBCC family protein [Streptomyces sp. NPDC048219]|uniref:SRPBCC family protein n=1 Tax=Streptomyces sp. NPDC048219 TaxID=3365517 RepID=UPI003713F18C